MDLNRWASSLVDCVTVIQKKEKLQKGAGFTGSLAQKKSVDMPELSHQKLSVRGTLGGKKYIGIEQDGLIEGLIEKGFDKFLGLIMKILSLERFEAKVSEEFVRDKVIDWVMTTYYDKKIANEFLTYIENEIEISCQDYLVKYEILNIRIEKEFEFGNSKFSYVTREFMEDFLKEKEESVSKLNFIEEFAGKVYVSCFIAGKEQRLAEAIAYEKCCRIVDLLKCYYQTTIFEQRPIYFELDRRCRYRISSTYLVHKNHEEFPSISSSFPVDIEEIDSNFIDWYCHADRADLLNIIENDEPENELQEMVQKSIEHLSAAMSIEDVHLRIVHMLTIWESILVLGKQPIRSTLIKYGVKLVADELTERKVVAELVGKMYEIRSDYLHNNEKGDYTTEELFEFRKQTFNLILGIMYLSKKFGTKKEMIVAMDEIIDDSVRIGQLLK